MLKPGIHTAFSSNWKAAVLASKPIQMNSDRMKVAPEVHSAIQRALRATSSSAPRSTRMKATPTIGRKMVRESKGQPDMALPRPQPDIPAGDQDDADQHGEGVMIDIARLQRRAAPRQAARDGGDAVGGEAVDDCAVAALPQGAADAQRRPHEQPVIELVEIPFVVEEEIDRPQRARQRARQFGAADIEEIGDRDAGEADDQRRQLDPKRQMLDLVEHVMLMQHQQ